MMAGMSEVVPVLDPSKFEVLGADMQILNLKLTGAQAVHSVPGAMTYSACAAAKKKRNYEHLGHTFKKLFKQLRFFPFNVFLYKR